MSDLQLLTPAAPSCEIDLVRPEPEDVPELARVCFEAFRTIHDHHGFARDFPDLQTAEKVVAMMVQTPEVFGVAARAQDGTFAGSNFLLVAGKVGGIGPITVDPRFQGYGIGRRLMQAILDHARQRGVTAVRLLQDSFNTTSLSLYASLGFDLREPVGLLRAPCCTSPDHTIRLATAADVPALGRLSEAIGRANREGELHIVARNNMPILVRETAGQLRGYLAPGKLGHGVMPSPEDALALVGQIRFYAQPGNEVFFLPLRHTALYRSLLENGCKLLKVMNLMTIGAYEEPNGCWMPSILY